MPSSDDLVPLLALAATSGAGLGYRQGIVMAWDPITTANTIMVDGILFRDLSILNTAEAAILQPGDSVGILTTGGKSAKSWLILGRATTPGTSAATSAYSAMFSRMRTARGDALFQYTGTDTGGYVPATQIDSSADEAILSDVLIGQSGSCLAITSGYIYIDPASFGTSNLIYAAVGAEVTRQSDGGVMSGANDARALSQQIGWGGSTSIIVQSGGRSSYTHWYTGLTPGLCQFALKYSVQAVASAVVQWQDPAITVIPL